MQGSEGRESNESVKDGLREAGVARPLVLSERMETGDTAYASNGVGPRGGSKRTDGQGDEEKR